MSDQGRYYIVKTTEQVEGMYRVFASSPEEASAQIKPGSWSETVDQLSYHAWDVTVDRVAAEAGVDR